MGKIFATILLILLLPLLIITSICIIIFSGSPVLFKHKRCGYKYTEFDIIKFRTMHDNEGPPLTEYNDLRITNIGKILRKLKIDEIPQLINFIKGEMDFIGPRPEVVDIVNNHPNYFTYLTKIKPGISDINSIIFKDEANILKNIDIDRYEYEILPIKSHLALITADTQNLIKKSILFMLSILAIINHKLSLRIISRFFLPYGEREFRIRLNNLLMEQIF